MSSSRLPLARRPGARRRVAVAAAVLAAVSLAAPAAALSAPGAAATAGAGQQAKVPSIAETLAALQANRSARQRAAVAAVRREAAAQPAPPALTAGYLISPAVFTFLTRGLGLNLSSPQLTGMTDAGPDSAAAGPVLSLTTAAPDLGALLPAGLRAAALPAAAVTVDERTGTLTMTTAGTAASVSVTITHAGTTTLAAGEDLTSRVLMPATVLGTPVTLAGGFTAAAAAADGGPARLSLSGALPVAVRPGGGVLLAAGDSVTAVTGGGLDLSGIATLGPAGHRLRVTVGGNVGDPRDWTLAVRSALGGAPLPGITLAAGAYGSVTDSAGDVSYDVHGRLAGSWQPASAVTFDSAAVEFATGRRAPASPPHRAAPPPHRGWT
jgi:hypothetical protein